MYSLNSQNSLHIYIFLFVFQLKDSFSSYFLFVFSPCQRCVYHTALWVFAGLFLKSYDIQYSLHPVLIFHYCIKYPEIQFSKIAYSNNVIVINRKVTVLYLLICCVNRKKPSMYKEGELSFKIVLWEFMQRQG